MLTLQHIAEGFQWTLVRTSDDAATTAVVKQCVDRFLQHPLFVTDNDVRCAKLNKTLQTVVTVDHAAIQVVQVGGRKTTAIQWHQWAKLWRDHRDHGQNHPLWAVARFDEAFDDLQTLDDLLRLQLACRFLEVGAQCFCFAFKVDQGEHFTNSFRANVGLERVHAVDVLCAVELFFSHQLAVSQVSETWLDHDVVFKVKNTLKITQSHIQHQTNTGWKGLQEPDVRNRSSKLDVAHTLTAYLLECYFNTAFLADNAAILHALIFAAQTFVIFDRAKDTGAEQAVPLWLESTVVDGFWFLNFAKRP